MKNQIMFQESPSIKESFKKQVPTTSTSTTKWGHWIKTVVEAEPFDLIEINRYNGVYQHWVMYLGMGNVVHVTQVKNRTEGDFGEMRVDKLRNIARKDECRVNNHSERGLVPLSRYEIMKHIGKVVNGQIVVVSYSAFRENCEHYATLWKYGEGFSKQVEDAISNNIPLEKIHASVELIEHLAVEDATNLPTFLENLLR